MRTERPEHPLKPPPRPREIAPAPAALEIDPDRIMSFRIVPGTYRAFRDSLGDEGPRLKCFQGDVTLVSPGQSHENKGHRLGSMILAVVAVLRIPMTALGSTTWELPGGAKDTGYEADESYYIQSHRTAVEGQAPDLAVEIVVSYPAKKAMSAGALLGIPESWVFDVPRSRLTFFRLIRRGKYKGTYQEIPRSRAFPFLTVKAVNERLADPETDDTVFHENCRVWADQVLRPLLRAWGNRP